MTPVQSSSLNRWRPSCLRETLGATINPPASYPPTPSPYTSPRSTTPRSASEHDEPEHRVPRDLIQRSRACVRVRRTQVEPRTTPSPPTCAKRPSPTRVGRRSPSAASASCMRRRAPPARAARRTARASRRRPRLHPPSRWTITVRQPPLTKAAFPGGWAACGVAPLADRERRGGCSSRELLSSLDPCLISHTTLKERNSPFLIEPLRAY